MRFFLVGSPSEVFSYVSLDGIFVFMHRILLGQYLRHYFVKIGCTMEIYFIYLITNNIRDVDMT